LDGTIEQLLDRGMHLFFVNKDKKPYWWSHGWKDGTNDKKALYDLCTRVYGGSAEVNVSQRFPQLAIATGPSNLFVIDVDNKPGKNGFETLETLEAALVTPPTWTVKTPMVGTMCIFKEGPLTEGSEREDWDPGLNRGKEATLLAHGL